MEYYHVDVFTTSRYNGNGLIVVFFDDMIEDIPYQKITIEFNQFETIFIKKISPQHFKARIFTKEEELEFAGHPILGASAVIHKKYHSHNKTINLIFDLQNSQIKSISEQMESNYFVTMHQKDPEYITTIPSDHYNDLVSKLNISIADLSTKYPVEVISTGLSYLLVPLVSGIETVKITDGYFEKYLEAYGAKFVYVFQIDTLVCRTWDNLGMTEDVATGSAAGPLTAYLVKHNLKNKNQEIILNQGQFVGRPSQIYTKYTEVQADKVQIEVSGEVVFFAKGRLEK